MRLHVSDLRPTQRRWRDLGKRRMFLSLAGAPVPPVLLGVLIIFAFVGASEPSRRTGSGILLAAIAWSLIAGSAYLQIVSRWRGTISRAECIILGVITAATLPTVAFLASPFFDWTGENISGRGVGIFLGIILVPFGLLGGWIFWRLGVRPAVATIGDLVPVFD